MTAISLKIEVEMGATPSDVIKECLVLARRLQIPIRFTHNGASSLVTWTDTEEKAMSRFVTRLTRQMEIYKANEE